MQSAVSKYPIRHPKDTPSFTLSDLKDAPIWIAGRQTSEQAAHTYKAVAKEWFEQRKAGWVPTCQATAEPSEVQYLPRTGGIGPCAK